MMDRRTAQNVVRLLQFVDRAEVPHFVDHGEDWQKFRSNPAQFFMKAPDAVADQIWAVASKGMQRT